MAKPRLIILIRHAQSEGNKNREIHQTVPDHRVKLTPEGWTQAREAGHRLRKLLRPDDTLQFFTSPYRRTRETTEGILSTLTSDDPEPSPFRRSHIKVYEEPRLREQDFGNFQPCTAEMERMWQERADYGHFFYRIPSGESAADAYDRVSGFNESLWRQFGDDDFPSVCVLVTHGLMSRVFLMKWYHFTVEYFEDLRNVNHCEFLLMRKQDNGKYLLETKLRTWSELRREKVAAQALKDKGKDGKDKDRDKEPKEKDEAKLAYNKSFVVTRRWGGCPDGCNHKAEYKRRQGEDAKNSPEDGDNGKGGNNDSSHKSTSKPRASATISSSKDDTKPADPTSDAASPSSPDGTPSYISRVSHLYIGRDFGGTYSGHPSVAGSDSEASEDEAQRRCRQLALDARAKLKMTTYENGDSHRHRHALANRLGDEPGNVSSSDPEEDLDEAEKEDRSILGSIY